MGVLVVLSLVYKRHRESPKRQWRIWCAIAYLDHRYYLTWTAGCSMSRSRLSARCSFTASTCWYLTWYLNTPTKMPVSSTSSTSWSIQRSASSHIYPALNYTNRIHRRWSSLYRSEHSQLLFRRKVQTGRLSIWSVWQTTLLRVLDKAGSHLCRGPDDHEAPCASVVGSISWSI